MPEPEALPSKPVTERYRPEITRLPRLTPWRRAARWFLVRLVRLVVRLLTRVRLNGTENTPSQGPVLVVSNHLGDADLVLGLAFSTRPLDAVSKADLYDYPVLGWLMECYGVIWVHRGQPDRRALRAVLEGLAEGRMIAIAPEGRESVTGKLEEGTHGAAYLALKSGALILPVTFTGTENWRVYGSIRRLRRAEISLTVGKPFRLEAGGDWRKAIEQGTEKIMRALAEQLPPEYRGVYIDEAAIDNLPGQKAVQEENPEGSTRRPPGGGRSDEMER
jgi:1-acyl-sn-glycerol-3-phosphate acyltransferase